MISPSSDNREIKQMSNAAKIAHIARTAPLNQLVQADPTMVELYELTVWVPHANLRRILSVKVGRSWIDDESFEAALEEVEARCEKANDPTR